jgi:hypothetical protein
MFRVEAIPNTGQQPSCAAHPSKVSAGRLVRLYSVVQSDRRSVGDRGQLLLGECAKVGLSFLGCGIIDRCTMAPRSIGS